MPLALRASETMADPLTASAAAAAATAATAAAAAVAAAVATESSEGKRHSRSGYVRLEDLDDLHPYLMYGSLLSYLRAVAQSLTLIASAALTWKAVVASVAFVTLLRALVHYRIFLLALVCSEGAFFVWMTLLHRRLQRLRAVEERPKSPSSPLEVWRRTAQTVEEFASWRSPTEWLEGWFQGSAFDSIRHDNMMEFVAWAFYTKQVDELDDNEYKEALGILHEGHTRFGWTFAPGSNPEVKPIRVNFDALDVVHRPLIYYLWIRFIASGTRTALQFLGFEYVPSTPGSGLSYFRCAPPQCGPGQLIEGGDAVPEEEQLPVVFIHGLGIGVTPYLRFIRRLAASREVFIIELPEIAQAGVKASLPPDRMVTEISQLLRQHGHQRACFIAHSYGTFVASWVIRARPDLVEKVVMMDPTCFLLSQPDVAFNVLYRRPCNIFSVIIAFAVRWELFAVNVLKRHFYWHHNVLWREELGVDCIVAVASEDDIVHARMVRSFVEETQRRRRSGYGKGDLKLLWFDGFLHGQLLWSRGAQMQIMSLL